MNQSEFRIIDPFFEEFSVSLLPNASLHHSAFNRFHISDRRDTIPTKEVTNARFLISFKMRSFT